RVARADINAGELAHEIALLIGHRGATVDCHGIPAMLGLNGSEAVGYRIECLIPAYTFQWAALATTAHQWISQAIRMIDRLIGCGSFGTKHTMVQREIFKRLYADNFLICNFEIHDALYNTITAMGGYLTINMFVSLSEC